MGVPKSKSHIAVLLSAKMRAIWIFFANELNGSPFSVPQFSILHRTANVLWAQRDRNI